MYRLLSVMGISEAEAEVELPVVNPRLRRTIKQILGIFINFMMATYPINQ
jgi:hypothetical protein